MKPSPHHDFPVGVIAARHEHAAEYDAAFAGIYTVTLNHTISIELVPMVDRRSPWPPELPELPENIDCPASSDEARRTAIRLASYAVTPDAQRAGGIERIPAELDTGVVFFVEPAEFDALSAECEALERRFSGIHDAVSVSALGASRLARFLLERFVPSGYLSDHELTLLGRAPARS